mgnify:CR=1 FL=1
MNDQPDPKQEPVSVIHLLVIVADDNHIIEDMLHSLRVNRAFLVWGITKPFVDNAVSEILQRYPTGTVYVLEQKGKVIVKSSALNLESVMDGSTAKVQVTKPGDSVGMENIMAGNLSLLVYNKYTLDEVLSAR